ncbi:MAG: DNA polymerase I [Bacteroidaceae bacterium]|nr:DNA polymerase I [Bacteroidaceae bacterium]
MDKLFLIDAYALIYRAYYAFIKSPRINSKGFNTSAVLGFVNTLEDILQRENPTHIGVAFDPKGGTFRHELYKEYKAQREETPEVIKESVPVIKDILNAYRIPILEIPGFEADDVIGTLAKKADEKGIRTYMMTPDKDYCQLVTENSMLYRPKYGNNGYDIMGPEEVKQKYGLISTGQIIDMLGLMGDSSDNIPGCPGVGEKTAVKLLSEFGTIDNLLANTGKLKGAIKEKIERNREQIIFSRLLATIRTDVPIELDMQSLKRVEPDDSTLYRIFENLEFRTLLSRFRDRQNNSSVLFGIQSDNPQTVSADKNDGINIKNERKNDGFHGDFFEIFQPDVQDNSKNSILKNIKSVEHNYYLIDNEEKAIELAEKLFVQDSICFDTETTGTDPITADIVGMSFCIKPHEAWYVAIPKDNEARQRIINIFKPVLENPDSLKTGQNIKYDILVMENCGIHVKGKLFDTMVAHYILQPELHHGMDYLSEVYLNYKTIHIEELIGQKGKNQKNMSQLEPEQIYEYACEDADVTMQLKEVLEQELIKDGTTALFKNIEMPLVRVLAYMERNGVRIDLESLKETSLLFTERMKSIEEQIFMHTGYSFNILSPKQVGEVLFERLKVMDKPKKTKTGQYVTSEDVLESIKTRHPVIELILQYRGLKKLLGTYVDALPLLVNSKTGRIHTSYNQTVTATGRLSSSNPNLQNIPVRDEDGKEVRKAFIPEPGCKFFSADYSQIELRIMAHLSGDTNMIEDFRLGHDIHLATAAKIFHKKMEEVTKTERNRAKTANFGIIYGISAFGLAERTGLSRTESKEMIDNYFTTYPQIKSYMNSSIQKAKEKGYIETLLKRKRYLPDINSHNATVRGFAERNAINAPIQGSAADIIKIAMIGIYRRFMEEELKSTMILQVHDELNFNVVAGEEQIVQKIVIDEMQNALSMSVPLIADCGWGNNWLEAH